MATSGINAVPLLMSVSIATSIDDSTTEQDSSKASPKSPHVNFASKPSPSTWSNASTSLQEGSEECFYITEDESCPSTASEFEEEDVSSSYGTCGGACCQQHFSERPPPPAFAPPPPPPHAGFAHQGSSEVHSQPPLAPSSVAHLCVHTGHVGTDSTPTPPTVHPPPPPSLAASREPCRARERFMAGLEAVLRRRASIARETSHTLFHLPRAPSISLMSYLERICEWFECSDACIVLALVFIDRAAARNPDVTITPQTSHQLLITSMMLAAKAHDDMHYSASFYAKVGGMSSTHLQALEKHFLKLLDWKIWVRPEEYIMYRDLLLDEA